MPILNIKGEKQTIVNVLVRLGLLSPLQKNQIESEVKDQDNFDSYLLARKMVTEEQLAKAYAILYGLQFISLVAPVPKETLEKIPQDLANKYKIIAYQSSPQVLKVAVAEPHRLRRNASGVMSEIGQQKGVKIELAIATPSDFQRAYEGYQQKEEKPRVVEEKKEQILSKQSDVEENIPLKSIDLSRMDLDRSALIKFPKDIAAKYRMICFDAISSDTINVALENPDDPKVKDIIKFIEEKNDIKINKFKTDTNSINYALRIYDKFPQVSAIIPPQPRTEKKIEKKEEKSPAEPFSSIESSLTPKAPKVEGELEEKNLDQFLGKPVENANELAEIIKTGNVPKILAGIVFLAVKMEASDIHIEPLETSMRLRYRIDGILQDISKLPIAMNPELISRVKILGKLKIDEHRIPQDGRFEAIALKHEVDLRISTLPTVNGEKAVLRILDKSVSMYTLEEIGLLGRNYDIVVRNVAKPYGVILATGPTGSGKTTTLYSILNRVSTPGVNIVTLEDPVEYEIPGINQCQVKPKIGFSFAEGLRSVLRQDPNIIMVGEIRDSETAQMVTHSALTGHLVLTTLHTNDAPGALPRLINMGVEPFLITSAINVILAQRLVRKLCPVCREVENLPLSTMQDIEKELVHFNLKKPLKFYKGRGCAKCTKGYKGRIGIFEVLEITDKIEALANNRATADQIHDQAIKEGMISIRQDGLLKALRGITTVEEVLSSTMK